MKTTTKNNPVQVGALLGVLGATLFFLMKQMGGSNASAVMLTPVADAPAESAAKIVAAGAAQGDQRDPFDHPALRRLAKDGKEGLSAQNQTGEAQAATEAARPTPPGSKTSFPAGSGQTVPVLSLLPDRTSVRGATPTTPFASPAPVAGNAKPAGSSGSPVAQEADDPLKGWRLTAIIAGQFPRAVIEGVGTGPTLVSVGGRVRALQVTAIQEREIVLQDALHLYTLPLLSAPSTSEENKDTRDSKDESAKEAMDAVSASKMITNTTRENAHGTAKTNP